MTVDSVKNAFLRTALDRRYRQTWIADPTVALSQLGVVVPSRVEVSIMECSTTSFVLPLAPMMDSSGSQEMTDDALESVTGGLTPAFFGVLLGSAILGAAIGVEDHTSRSRSASGLRA